MSTTTAPPATTPIPVQLSESEFTTFILPHLSMPKRGPKCKLGYYRVFNLILWLLYTGMQWKCLPIPQDSTGTPVIHLSSSRLNVKCRQNLRIRYSGANVVTSCFLECQKPGELKSR